MKSCILGILKFSNGEAPARVEMLAAPLDRVFTPLPSVSKRRS